VTLRYIKHKQAGKLKLSESGGGADLIKLMAMVHF
jgi:hypothetical protein